MEMTLDSSIDTAEEEIIRRNIDYLSLLIRDENIAILIHSSRHEGIELELQKELLFVKISDKKRKELNDMEWNDANKFIL